MSAIAETFNFGFGLLAPIAFLFVAVSFITSPMIIAWWGLDAMRGKTNAMLADQSEQARLVVVFHVVTTGLDVLLVAWMIGTFH